MTGEDLYKEEKCSQCGQKKLTNASFCPHCGYVRKRTWLDRLRETLSGFSGGEAVGTKRGMGVSTLLGLAFAGYLAYTAIEEGSLQNMILAVLILFTVLQSWYAARKRTEKTGEASVEGLHELQGQGAEPLEGKFYCENCGTEVGEESVECPKCWRKFGQ